MPVTSNKGSDTDSRSHQINTITHHHRGRKGERIDGERHATLGTGSAKDCITNAAEVAAT